MISKLYFLFVLLISANKTKGTLGTLVESTTLPDYAEDNECSKFLSTEGLVPISTATDDLDLIHFGTDARRKMFVCSVEINGKTYFGKGIVEMAHPFGNTELKEMEVTNCWISDGHFESYVKSGFKVLIKPPMHKYSLKWQNFTTNATDRGSIKNYLLSNGAINIDSKKDNGFIGRCMEEDVSNLHQPDLPVMRTAHLSMQKRTRRFAINEEKETFSSMFVGFINPYNLTELLTPFGGWVRACNNFQFLSCNPRPLKM